MHVFEIGDKFQFEYFLSQSSHCCVVDKEDIEFFVIATGRDVGHYGFPAQNLPKENVGRLRQSARQDRATVR